MKFVLIFVSGIFAFWVTVFKADSVGASGSCFVDGVEYRDGSKTPDPCDRCECFSGRVACLVDRCTKEWMADLKKTKKWYAYMRQPWDGKYDNVDLGPFNIYSKP